MEDSQIATVKVLVACGCGKDTTLYLPEDTNHGSSITLFRNCPQCKRRNRVGISVGEGDVTIASFKSRIDQLEDEVTQLHQKQFDDTSVPKRLAAYIGQLRGDSLARLTEECRKACARLKVPDGHHSEWVQERCDRAAHAPLEKL